MSEHSRAVPVRRRWGGAMAVLLLLLGLATTPPAAAAPTPLSALDFNTSSFAPWQSIGGPTLSFVPDGQGGQALSVGNRSNDYDGIRTPAGLFAGLPVGAEIQVSMKVRLAAGTPSTQVRFVRYPGYAWIANTTVSADGWTTISGTTTIPETTEDVWIYVGSAALAEGQAYTYLVDDVTVLGPDTGQNNPGVGPGPLWSQVVPLQDSMPFPLGVAIDQRETTGTGGAAVVRHFGQITAENHMKPDSWYDQARQLRPHPQAVTMMDFARTNGLRVFGHVLVWHDQTPSWFFQDAGGQSLTTSSEHRQLLRDRMRAHIFGVAQQLSQRYGLFGSPENPLVAWDVVNEVVDDSNNFADGLRRSEWYRILGEEFIDLAFRYADEAFNETYAAPGTDRPVTLFINDYNTETTYSQKRQRYLNLITRLLSRDVPVDGVGHQFHVGLSVAPSVLDTTLTSFSSLGLVQAVTEFDVPTGTPVSDALWLQQGRYYREAFQVFRRHAAHMFSVSIWGLHDARSWRNNQGGPLVFDSELRIKPAFEGAAGIPLPGESSSTLAPGAPGVFDPTTAADALWAQAPTSPIGTRAQLRALWGSERLGLRVEVVDSTAEATDSIDVTVNGVRTTVLRSAPGAGAVVRETTEGWTATVGIPLPTGAVDATVPVDVVVVDGNVRSGWNGRGATGSVELAEPLPDATVDLVATGGVRCVAGRAMPTVEIVNRHDYPLTVTVRGPGSSKSFPAVQPGGRAFHAFTTRQQSVSAGTVLVTATEKDGQASPVEWEIDHPGTTC